MKSLALLSLLAMVATISTTEHQCPSFTCTSSKDHCVSVNTQLEAYSMNKKVELSKCENDTWYCDYEPQFWINHAYNASCKEPQPEVLRNRLPGEPCTDNSNCVQGSTCNQERCTGQNVNETCTRNEKCLAGNWCAPPAVQGRNRTCQPQVAVGGKCTNEFQCVNNAFCHDGHCVEYFSLAADTTLKERVLTSNYACESIRAVLDTAGDFKCVEPRYVKNANDGVVECKNGEMCQYDIGMTSNLELPCVCGYNAEGKGYCPYDYASQSCRVTSLGKAFLNAFNNKCHTANRFTCPESDYSEVRIRISDLSVALHKAVDCAKSVLS